jgi:hypothetical protein
MQSPSPHMTGELAATSQNPPQKNEEIHDPPLKIHPDITLISQKIPFLAIGCYLGLIVDFEAF